MHRGPRRANPTSLAARGPLAVVAASAVAASMLGAGCSSSAEASKTAAHTTTVNVAVRDFAVSRSRSVVPAGRVTFDVRNAGPSTHELKVVRTDLPASALPVDAGGLAVDEESPRLHQVGGIDTISRDARARLSLDLPPGRYVIYCNLEGHYLGGTYTELDVKAPKR